MKNALFFTGIFLTLIFTSCQKEVIAPTPFTTTEQTVQNRSETSEIEVTVAQSELTATKLIVLFDSDEDLKVVTPEANQTLSFTHATGVTTFDFQVNTTQVINDQLEMIFDLDGLDLSGYELDGGQFIIIDETDID